MKALGQALAAMAALGFMTAPAYAQRVNTSAPGVYGQVSLTNGFEPDPYTVTVNGGGAIDASTLNESCAGYIDARASFTLNYRAGEWPLYISGASDADTTLVVRTPNGSWVCDDDSGGNLNPRVGWDDPASGRYQVWLGRFGAQNETATGTLRISELAPDESAGAVGDGPDFSLDPAYGAVDMAAGFTPDPHTQAIAAGGSINAAVLGVDTCVGWIAQAPDYRVNWTGTGPLIFSVNSEADTTLVINDGQGNWVCDDDGGNIGANPSVAFQSAPSGQYDVWVGTYAQGDLQDSTLYVSEQYSQ